MKLDIKEARKELEEKDEDTIERETAVKWASRAAAAYELCTEAKTLSDQVRLFSWGDDLYHEALEHAALAREPSLVADVKRELDERRKDCEKLFQKGEKPRLGKRIVVRHLD